MKTSSGVQTVGTSEFALPNPKALPEINISSLKMLHFMEDDSLKTDSAQKPSGN
jgi:hypothetical protein